MKKLLFLLVLTGFLASCEKTVDDRREEDDISIQSYFNDNSINDAEEIGETGIYFRITEEGDNGDLCTPTSIVRVFYEGYLLDGSVFDMRVEGEDDYLESYLGNLVYGWQVGLPKFTKGTKGQLFIPSFAGYGNQERQGIPRNSVLVFDIHLVNFFQ